ncbi:RYamide receptor isoform X2 [Chironomus tepperi]|uniref:RYamide receptor isoform X2 n=1 Tax=Chironomus tepperi TaxID=113505 RepID=UPI00391F3291
MDYENNNLRHLRWNASSHQYYASQYPYILVDDSHFQHILNYTIEKGDAIFANGTSFKSHNEMTGNTNNTDFECNASHEHDESGWFSMEFQATLHFMYITIFIISLLGNAMVVFIVCQSSRMQTVTNYFIANLALADMSMAFFCIPFSFISQFVLQYWPFGSLLCRIVNYTQAISVLVSAYTLVAISIDRYIAIMFPLKPRLSKRYAKLIISIVWVIALATASPIPIMSTLIQPTSWFQKCDRYFCMELWAEKEHKDYYSLVLMSLQFIIPLAVLIFTYTRIAVVVWGKKPPGEAENLRDLRMARSKRKMIKMMLAVVFVFIFCWLPFNLFMLLGPDESTESPLLPYLWFAFHWLAMSHSCYNPIIYGLMNSRFKACFIAVLYRIPGFQKFFARRLRGFDENSHLHRMNTSTTYISTRRKQQHTTGKIVQKVETSCFCEEASVHR